MALVERRIGLLFAAFLVLLALAGLRSLQLGTFSSDRLTAAAASQQLNKEVVPARRGTITDRKGTELAVSEATDDISATPYLVKDPHKTARALAPLLGVDETELVAKLTPRVDPDTGEKVGFVYLKKQVPAAKADRIRKLAMPGIDLTPNQHRDYPQDYLASQLLGGVDAEGKGNAGIEYVLERKLHGTDGERRFVRDGVGDDVQIRDPKRAIPGSRVELTIDSAIQNKVEEVLQGVGTRYNPAGATAIVMDPRNGEVLAMANWPQIDANDPSAAPSYANQNRAVAFNFEPGSTFKAFTVAGALEDDVVQPDTQFFLQPQIQVADRVIKEAHDRGPVTLDTGRILAQSSNVGAITIGLKLGKVRFDHWVRTFGFGSPTGIDLPGEQQGIVRKPSEYSGSTMGNVPIGQGELVTPIQIATAYAAIANGGVLRPPSVVRRIDGVLQPEARGKRILSESTAREVRKMLEGVLGPGGTAPEAQIPNYVLAGKTGTANKVDQETGEYSESAYVASFVGFAPAANPKLLVSVMVDEPKGDIFGGSIAGPAFQKIAAFALPYLKIPPK